MGMVFGNATDAWEYYYGMLRTQEELGFNIPSRGGAVVGEILNASLTILDPTRGIVMSPTRDMDMRYALGELMFYLSGSNRLADIAQYSRFWNKLSDNGLTVNSAYGYRIHTQYDFDQWEHCKDLLINDPYSRQAVIHIKEPSDKLSKDVACTLSLQFFIREGLLHMTTTMRSNDIWLGFPFDVFCFTAMQVKMAMELGTGLGTYTHNVGSLHLYKKDVKKSDPSIHIEDTNKN